jgi:hypothetical protein
MGSANYKIVQVNEGWGIEHDGEVSGSYATKEIAFEMAALAASNAIKKGHDVSITVPGTSAANETALGAR